MASRLSTCELENGIIYCCSLFYSILGLFSWLHVCTPQNTPPKMATGKKKKMKKMASQNYHICFTKTVYRNGWLLTTLFPGKTRWWDATRFTYQAYQAPFNCCQLRDIIWAINTWWHWKEIPNQFIIWNKMVSAKSITKLTLKQNCPIVLWRNYKDSILFLAMQTRPCLNREYTYEQLHLSFQPLRSGVCIGSISHWLLNRLPSTEPFLWIM